MEEGLPLPRTKEDRQRRREARARGDRFREYTWYDVVEHSGPTRAELWRLLAGAVIVVT